MFAAKYAATGCPGRPSIGLFPALPSIVGFPGFIATPWSNTSPTEAVTRTLASFSPTLLPPDIMTASHSSSARRTVFSSTCTSSGHMPYLTHRVPKRESIAHSIGAFASRICPFAGAHPASTSSSPVEITPTFILPVTGTAVTPAAASAPISCGNKTRPFSSIFLPGKTSSPRKIIFMPGAPGFAIPTVPST